MNDDYIVTVIAERYGRRMTVERVDGKPIRCGWDRLQALKNEFLLMHPHKKPFTFVAVNPDGTEEEIHGEVITKFSYFAVFPISATDPIPGFRGKTYEQLYPPFDEQAFLDRLPLLDVARAWGIKVGTYAGSANGASGFMLPGALIALGVENLATWAHELVHEADFRAGNMKVLHGQERTNEIVAELGGAVLLTMLGLEADADWGGAFEYIQSYAVRKDREGLVKEVRELVWRIGAAIKTILAARTEEPC